MGSTPEAAAFFLEQAGPEVSLRRMFGEYAVKSGEKTLGLICDDVFYVKLLQQAGAYLGTQLGEAPQGEPFPGAKPHYKITPDHWEDAAFLREILAVMERALPAPKPKKPKTAKKAAGGLPPDMPPELF